MFSGGSGGVCLHVSVCVCMSASALKRFTLSGRGEADGGPVERPPILEGWLSGWLGGPLILGEIK